MTETETELERELAAELEARGELVADEADAGELEPEAPAAAPAGPDSAELLQKLERARSNYAKRVNDLLGEDASRHDCPACEGLGMVWGEPEAPPELRESERYHACDECDGFGEVLTGARNPMHKSAMCVRCSGRGYLDATSVAPVATPTPVPVETAPTPIGGVYVPGKGFVPYGATEPLPGTA